MDCKYYQLTFTRTLRHLNTFNLYIRRDIRLQTYIAPRKLKEKGRRLQFDIIDVLGFIDVSSLTTLLEVT